MLNKTTIFLKEIFKRLISERSPKRCLSLINFCLAKRMPSFFSPTSIGISITDKCNLKCPVCTHRYISQNKNEMSFLDFKYLIRQFPFLEHVHLSSYGECFLNKDLFRMLAYLKMKKITAALASNFTLIDEKTSGKLIEAGNVNYIFASIDSADKAAYEKLKPGADFDRVLENIRIFESLRKQSGKRYPEIIVTATVSNENLFAMRPLVELAGGLGLKTVIFSRVMVMDNYPSAYLQFIEAAIPDFSLYVTEGRKAAAEGKKQGVSVICNLKHRACTHLESWQEMTINHDGSVWPCCFLDCYDHNSSRQPFGNIFSDSFRSIWLSKRYKKLRKSLRKGVLPDSCRDKGCCVSDFMPNNQIESNILIDELAKCLNSGRRRQIPRSIGEELGYSKDDKLLIITADDFGMCQPVNKATIDVLKSGTVTSCGIMPAGPGFEAAALHCRNNPDLDVGIHLTLTSEFDNLAYRPISAQPKVRSLIGPDGCFHKDLWEFKARADLDEVRDEIIAQIEAVIEKGIKPTHLSSHMFILNYLAAADKNFREVIADVFESYRIPFRAPGNSFAGRRLSFPGPERVFWETYFLDYRQKEKFYRASLKKMNPGLNEITIHCGRPSAELKNITEYYRNYEKDLNIFSGSRIRQYINTLGIKLISWKPISELWKNSLSGKKNGRHEFKILNN